MKFGEFIETWGEPLAAAVARACPPRHDDAAARAGDDGLWRLRRRPLGAQALAIRAAAGALRRGESPLVVGEMGVGKCLIGAAAADLGGCRRVLVVCPPHLVRKWRREITATVPGADVAIVRTVAELERARRLGGRAAFVIVSREQVKLGYRWVPAVVERPARDDDRPLRDEVGRPVSVLCCPACFAAVTDEEGVPVGRAELEIKRRRCCACGGPLWQADRGGPRRVALADYVRRRMRGHFDLLVIDELHEMKGRGSAQGLASGGLAAACGRSLGLTGTLFGGYSSSLFYLLQRFSPREVRPEFGYRDEGAWVARYGIVERITRKDPDGYAEDGRQSRRRAYTVRTVERPGVAPGILRHLVGGTIFLRLADLGLALPPYEERVALVPLDDEPDGAGESQARAYARLAAELRAAILAGGPRMRTRLLAAYLQALLGYPDGCTAGEAVYDRRTGDLVAAAPALDPRRLYPKERALVELVRRERARGRRALIYLQHTERRDLTPRLGRVLAEAGLRAATLKAGTVAPARREEWLAARAGEGLDALLLHPKLAGTGLDLLDWPTAIWLQPDYSAFTLRQASRRAWRIGQQRPVEVHYLAYGGTLQAEALALVAAKVRAALLVEGELPEDGLAALGDAGGDVVLALARRLVEGTAGAPDAASLEALLAEARAAEAAAGQLLIDDAAAPPADGTAMCAPAPATRRGPSLEELAVLVARRSRRARPAPVGQLGLFEAGPAAG
jgi:superfamily II DNA or RNA helicase